MLGPTTRAPGPWTGPNGCKKKSRALPDSHQGPGNEPTPDLPNETRAGLTSFVFSRRIFHGHADVRAVGTG